MWPTNGPEESKCSSGNSENENQPTAVGAGTRAGQNREWNADTDKPADGHHNSRVEWQNVCVDRAEANQVTTSKPQNRGSVSNALFCIVLH